MYILDVVLNALGQVEEESISLEDSEGISSGVCSALEFEHSMEQFLCLSHCIWSGTEVRGVQVYIQTWWYMCGANVVVRVSNTLHTLGETVKDC